MANKGSMKYAGGLGKRSGGKMGKMTAKTSGFSSRVGKSSKGFGKETASPASKSK